jgi:glutathione S-transferase
MVAPDHSPDARNMVSAAVPSEEDLTERIIAFLKLRDEMVTDPDERTDDERDESAKELAALFAPLAEKPPTLADDAALPEIAVQPQPRIGVKRASDDNRAAVDAWQARALAAEAALAAERERCAKLVEKIGACANTSGRGESDERFAEDIASAIREG